MTEKIRRVLAGTLLDRIARHCGVTSEQAITVVVRAAIVAPELFQPDAMHCAFYKTEKCRNVASRFTKAVALSIEEDFAASDRS